MYVFIVTYPCISVKLETEFSNSNVNAFGVNFVKLIIDKVLLSRNTKITRGIVLAGVGGARLKFHRGWPSVIKYNNEKFVKRIQRDPIVEINGIFTRFRKASAKLITKIALYFSFNSGRRM